MPLPVPFNVDALDGSGGEVLLCASVADAVVLTDWGCLAVAIPEPPGVRDVWRERFAGRHVLVLEDPGAGGRRGAEDRAATLRGVAKQVDVVRMPGGGRAETELRGLARPPSEGEAR